MRHEQKVGEQKFFGYVFGMAPKNVIVEVIEESLSGMRIERILRVYGPFSSVVAKSYVRKINEHLRKAGWGDQFYATTRRLTAPTSRLTSHFRRRKPKK